MRVMFPALLLALAPLSAMAQAGPPPGGITRAQFIQRAADAAAQRFDAIDVGHTGVVTRAQIRAWRQGHPGQRALPAPTAP